MSAADMRSAADTRVRTAAVCRATRDAADLADHHAVRHAVFVEEQAVFTPCDHDRHDADPATVHVLGLIGALPAGTVRLYPLDPGDPAGDWQGDRLAVLPGFRSSGIGRPLVQFAVATAAALGGRRMIAHVQLPNRAFFRHLGWAEHGGPELYVGIPHQLMEIGLRP